MVKHDPIAAEGVAPADCGVARKHLESETSRHQRGRQQPQPHDGKTRRPPLAPENATTRLSVAEQLRQHAAKRGER
jgi:hypothetical protein